MRSQIQACQKELPPQDGRAQPLTSDIRRELEVELLLLRVERNQLRRFGHLIRMPYGRLPLEVFQTQNPLKGLHSQSSLGTPQAELECVVEESEVWTARQNLLPSRPDPG